MRMNNRNSDKYYGLNGLRAIAALGIIGVHVAKNFGFEIDSFWFRGIVCRLETFVNLFFILSAFSMCCGYYTKIKENKITLDEFYKKRYIKIWPFFAFLVLIDTIYSWQGITTFSDAFADLTLAFAFLPDSSISIIGVGWTLGVIFAFYMLFPFFVFCIWNKKRAWLSFVIALLFDLLKDYYFANETSYVLCNILVWAVYFFAGGLIYLYRNDLKQSLCNYQYSWLALSVLSLILWFALPEKIYGIDIFTYKTIIAASCWIIYAMCYRSRCLDNKISLFISNVSFEIYLSHMLVYRFVQKFGIVCHLNSNSSMSFLILFLIVSFGSIIFASVVKLIIKRANLLMKCRS